MDSEPWKKVEDLYHAALERAPSERDAFLEKACAGDEALLREVKSLLAADGRAERFIEEPVGEAATRAGPGGDSRLSAGSKLGPYEILAPLGAGGMGEVYRASDPRLKRDVALKVLPADLASDPERLRRFEREAQALAALNHPHIVTIFTVEEAEGLHFLTMELVEGRTLSGVIPRGGLSLPHFFRIALPLAEAVAAAHEKGITHRDLKPGNVMVTEEDRIKVLDFGLAKLRQEAAAREDSETPTVPATEAGRVLGTAPYMSPEQIQGRPVDHRSDVFSLGILLYEMVTGDRPFHGTSSAELAYSILRDTPASVTERRAHLPRDLGRLIKHCLEKEPRKRYQSTLDLANDLAELRREVDTGEALLSSGAPLATIGGGRRRRVWLAGGAVVAALALVVGYLLSSRTVKLPTEPIKITPLTADGGEKKDPALSPDGELVAYSWAGPADDNWDIYVKGLGPGTSPLRLTEDPAHDRSPVWSPDGRQIAFVRDLEEGSAIYTIPWPSGPEHRLIQLAGPIVWQSSDNFVTTLSWSPDGRWLAYARKPSADEPARIVRLGLATVEEQALTSPPRGSRTAAGDLYPALSPDGSQVAFVREGRSGWDVWVQPVDGGEPRRLTFEQYSEISDLAWTVDGDEILFTDFSSKRFTLRVNRAGGPPSRVVGLGEGAESPSVRGDRLVYRQSTVFPYDTWRIPGPGASAPGGEAEKLIVSSRWDISAAYSPDGRRIVFGSRRSGVLNIWVCDSDGSHPVQLTRFETGAQYPRWSPDGRRLVFASAEAGDFDVYVVDADGGVPRRLTQEPPVDTRGTWSRDGRWVYFNSDRGGDWQIWKMPTEGGEAVQVTRSGGVYPEESWGGQYLFYAKSRVATAIWRVPVEGGEETEVVPGPLAWCGDWTVARSGLYYATERARGRREEYVIHHLDLESGQVSEVYRKDAPTTHAYLSVSPGEEWLLVAEEPFPQSELMLMENFR